MFKLLKELAKAPEPLLSAGSGAHSPYSAHSSDGGDLAYKPRSRSGTQRQAHNGAGSRGHSRQSSVAVEEAKVAEETDVDAVRIVQLLAGLKMASGMMDYVENFSQILSTRGKAETRRAFRRHGGFKILVQTLDEGLAWKPASGGEDEEAAQVNEVQRMEGIRLAFEVLAWAQGDREGASYFERHGGYPSLLSKLYKLSPSPAPAPESSSPSASTTLEPPHRPTSAVLSVLLAHIFSNNYTILSLFGPDMTPAELSEKLGEPVLRWPAALPLLMSYIWGLSNIASGPSVKGKEKAATRAGNMAAAGQYEAYDDRHSKLIETTFHILSIALSSSLSNLFLIHSHLPDLPNFLAERLFGPKRKRHYETTFNSRYDWAPKFQGEEDEPEVEWRAPATALREIYLRTLKRLLEAGVSREMTWRMYSLVRKESLPPSREEAGQALLAADSSSATPAKSTPTRKQPVSLKLQLPAEETELDERLDAEVLELLRHAMKSRWPSMFVFTGGAGADVGGLELRDMGRVWPKAERGFNFTMNHSITLLSCSQAVSKYPFFQVKILENSLISVSTSGKAGPVTTEPEEIVCQAPDALVPHGQWVHFGLNMRQPKGADIGEVRLYVNGARVGVMRVPYPVCVPPAPEWQFLGRSSGAATESHTPVHQGSIRGTLSVKLISAKGLAVSHGTASEPYVVMQFEQNEFISAGPLPASSPASVPFTTSTAQPMMPNLPRSSSALGVGTISRAFADAMSRGKGRKEESGAQTPKAEEPAGGGSWLGKPGPGDPVWKEEVAFDLTSSNSALHVSVYDRGREGEGFLGMLDIKPVLKDGYTLDGWHKLGTRGKETVTGEVWLQLTYHAIRNKVHLRPSDFEFLKLIGRGTFGRVFQVRKRDTRRIYAMKVLSKKEIVAKKEVAHTIGERKILQRSLECPFLVGLKFSFQTEKELYFVTDYKCGGELFWHLQKEGRFSEDRARFYIAELILALEHLHKYNIVYRDLKPENILLDATGHVALCDFGLSKPDLSNDQLTNTFCGTTEYLAPEVLLDEKGYGKHVDFWSLGVLLFEMCCGWSPFYAEQTQEMYRLICYGKIRFPKHDHLGAIVIGEDGKQFVKGLLNRNPLNRLGAKRGAAELKEHPFFASIEWDLLYNKQITPPFKPIVDSDESVANFDPEFTNSSLQDAGAPITDDDGYEGPQAGKHTFVGPGGSLRDASHMHLAKSGGGVAIKPSAKGGLSGVAEAGSMLTSSVQENFRGFTYTGESLMPQSLLDAGRDGAMDDGSDHEHAVEEGDEDDEEYDEDEEMEGARTRRQSDVDMD